MIEADEDDDEEEAQETLKVLVETLIEAIEKKELDLGAPILSAQSGSKRITIEGGIENVNLEGNLWDNLIIRNRTRDRDGDGSPEAVEIQVTIT